MTSDRQQQSEELLQETLIREVTPRDAAVTSEAVGTGRRISHYQVLSLLGKGGMGEVYLAQDQRLKRKVALKMLPAEFTRDANLVRRFEQEAFAISALNHPNIITIHEIGEDAGDRFIAMEFIEGRTLRAVIAEGCELNALVRIGGQIAKAMNSAHAAGITHRDIKPDNIMVRADGYVKILDFGLARLLPTNTTDSESPTLAQQTMPGTIMGTVAYMSPEQTRGETVSHPSDIFAFGVVLYEMATGQHPFRSDTMVGYLHAITLKTPVPPAQLNPNLPAALESWILQMLEKDESARPTAAQVEAALEPTALSSATFEMARTASVAPLGHQTNQVLLATNEIANEAMQTRMLTNSPNSLASPALTANVAQGSRKKIVFVAVAALLVAAAAGLGLWLYRPAPKAAPTATTAVRLSLLTSDPGSEREPAFSPDGKSVAFIWDGGSENDADATDIYVKLASVTGANPIRLTDDPASDYKPVWSPDGYYVAFLRRQMRGVETVMVVPYTGGQAKPIAQVAGGLDWSPDGEWLAVVKKGEPDGYQSIYLLKKETKEFKRITQAEPGAMRDEGPVFSPDGKTIAFIRLVSSAVMEVFTVPTAGGTPQRLTSDKRTVLNLSWMPDGKQIVFVSDRSGRPGLWRMPATGGEPEQIAAVSGNVIDVSVARQGERLVCSQEDSDTSIYLQELVGGKKRKWEKFIFSTRSEHSPIFSPDGKQIAFVSKRSGSPEVWVCDSDGQHPVQLTHFNGPQTGSPRWSPDGTQISLDSRPEGQAEIFVISAQGGKPRQLTFDKALDVTPSWSGDGQWIYFSSNRSGNRQIWKVPAAGGDATQVTQKGGFEPVESLDGQFIYYAKGRDISGMARVPVAGGTEEDIPELATAGYHRYWSLTDKGIYFVPEKVQPRPVINFFNFLTRKVTQAALPEKAPIYGPSGMSISRDGRRLLYTQNSQIVSDITLIENFR